MGGDSVTTCHFPFAYNERSIIILPFDCTVVNIYFKCYILLSSIVMYNIDIVLPNLLGLIFYTYLNFGISRFVVKLCDFNFPKVLT